MGVSPVVGGKYAYRERVNTIGDPVRPVEVVRLGPPKSQKVRVRWLDGEYEGLEEWIPRVRLLVPWDETEAYLKDERLLLAAWEATGSVHETVTWRAVELVLGAVPTSSTVALGYRGGEQDLLVIEGFEATVMEHSLDRTALISAPHAYVDRHGDYRAPFEVAEKLAKKFCEKFPLDILRAVQAEEEAYQTAVITGHYVGPGWLSDGYDNSPSHFEKEFQKEAPVYALVREWCGGEARSEFDRIRALESEVQRLRTLVSSVVDWLKSSGHHVRAAAVVRELNLSTKANDRKGSRSGRGQA